MRAGHVEGKERDFFLWVDVVFLNERKGGEVRKERHKVHVKCEEEEGGDEISFKFLFGFLGLKSQACDFNSPLHLPLPALIYSLISQT